MTRLIALALVVTVTAAGVFAASDGAWLDDSADFVVEIPVSASDLAACQQVLAEVAARPVVTDAGTPVLFHNDSDLPTVACVVR